MPGCIDVSNGRFVNAHEVVFHSVVFIFFSIGFSCTVAKPRLREESWTLDADDRSSIPNSTGKVMISAAAREKVVGKITLLAARAPQIDLAVSRLRVW
jgi:hypothetical protein